MVKIRLTRVGRKKAPFYRIVVADSRRARDGKVIEYLGRYQPLNKDSEEQITVEHDRAIYWLNNGAQPTDTVRSILRKKGIMKEYHEAKLAEKQKRKAEKAG